MGHGAADLKHLEETVTVFDTKVCHVIDRAALASAHNGVGMTGDARGAVIERAQSLGGSELFFEERFALLEECEFGSGKARNGVTNGNVGQDGGTVCVSVPVVPVAIALPMAVVVVPIIALPLPVSDGVGCGKNRQCGRSGPHGKDAAQENRCFDLLCLSTLHVCSPHCPQSS